MNKLSHDLPLPPPPPPSLMVVLRSPWLQEEGAAAAVTPMAPSSDAPLVFICCCCLLGTCSSPSTSSGEAKRCVSISAEKRRRARAEGGLASLSGRKDDSEHDKRFLVHMTQETGGGDGGGLISQSYQI